MSLVAWFLCAQISTQPAVPAPSVPSHAENLVACSTWIPTFGPRGTLARPAYAFAVHDFGAGPQLVVGGELGATGPTTLRGVALWTGSGFAPFAGGFNSNSLVGALVTDPDPTVGGLIALGSSIPGGGVARWNGSFFAALGSGLALANPSYPGEPPFGIARAVHDAGAGAELYVVGRFDRAGGQVCTGFAKWNGTAWSVPATPPISGIRALVQ
ncbi:MAG: hypothetical protein NTY35_11185 [Planctomycetota bacterium]|nr:hypothetical protein [Planctomycetota bacterium]